MIHKNSINKKQTLKIKKRSNRSHKLSIRKTKTVKKRGSKHIKNKKMFGGGVERASVFSNIKSIGFEIETTDLIKFTIENHDGADLLVNSALTNIDLEYGYSDMNEYTDIIDTPDVKFKITNDSAEDSAFNKLIEEKVFSIHKDSDDDEDCDSVILKLSVPENPYYNQTLYDIKVKEPNGELVNCSSFTDVEWIITYYNPRSSDDIILHYFSESMKNLKNHLYKLVTVSDSQLLYLNNEEEFVPMSFNEINQSYVLPSTSLVYLNNSEHNIENYDIKKNLKIVVQMTFSCEINNVIPIMEQLLRINLTQENKSVIEKYKVGGEQSKSLQEIEQIIDAAIQDSNPDLFALEESVKITDKLFEKYNQVSDYFIDITNSEGKSIYSYLFLIIYKLFVYFNSYLEGDDPLFKKHLAFAVRHNNYRLFLEIRKTIANMFFDGIDDEETHEEITNIINNIIKPLDSDIKIMKTLFSFPNAKSKKMEMLAKIKKNPDVANSEFGNPLVSVSNYFAHFITGLSGEEEDMGEDNQDWLVANSVDTKSTKFPLNNNIIIIEFRDFPKYCYLYLFLNGNDQIRSKILQNNIGTLNMEIVSGFIDMH